jgi:hypothetical protein
MSWGGKDEVSRGDGTQYIESSGCLTRWMEGRRPLHLRPAHVHDIIQTGFRCFQIIILAHRLRALQSLSLTHARFTRTSGLPSALGIEQQSKARHCRRKRSI